MYWTKGSNADIIKHIKQIGFVDGGIYDAEAQRTNVIHTKEARF